MTGLEILGALASVATIATSVATIATKPKSPSADQGMRDAARMRERQKRILGQRRGLESTVLNPLGVAPTQLGVPSLFEGKPNA